jgi:small subunit ribosomal protein S6
MSLEKVKRPYEAIIIMHPDAQETDQKALMQKNKSIIEGFGGGMNHIDTWGKRLLGNPIAKSRKGFYFHTTFEAQPEAIAELERTMRLNDKVLRFAHTRLKDDVSLTKHVEDFKQMLTDTLTREKEREMKKRGPMGGHSSRE